jgi:regulator of replication initiation timing
MSDYRSDRQKELATLLAESASLRARLAERDALRAENEQMRERLRAIETAAKPRAFCTKGTSNPCTECQPESLSPRNWCDGCRLRAALAKGV